MVGWLITGLVSFFHAANLWRDHKYGDSFVFGAIGTICLAVYVVRA